MGRFWTSQTPGPIPKPKNDDFVQARPLKRSRFGPPQPPDPDQNPKNDDSVQARPFKMSRFGSPERRLPPVLALLRGPGQQSERHGATHATRPPAIPKTRRHPDDALVSNPQDTAPPRGGRAAQQSPWHGTTERTRRPAIPITQRHPRDTPSSNPHGTAPHTPHTRRARRQVLTPIPTARN